MRTEASVSDMVGAVLSDVRGLEAHSDTAIFRAEDGREWWMHHNQACCETVYIEDVCGDPQDLVGSPILAATVTTEDGGGELDNVSSTWTFYRLSTIEGTVVIRWYGGSNGYYSEAVDFELEG